MPMSKVIIMWTVNKIYNYTSMRNIDIDIEMGNQHK